MCVGKIHASVKNFLVHLASVLLLFGWFYFQRLNVHTREGEESPNSIHHLPGKNSVAVPAVYLWRESKFVGVRGFNLPDVETVQGQEGSRDGRRGHFIDQATHGLN